VSHTPPFQPFQPEPSEPSPEPGPAEPFPGAQSFLDESAADWRRDAPSANLEAEADSTPYRWPTLGWSTVLRAAVLHELLLGLDDLVRFEPTDATRAERRAAETAVHHVCERELNTRLRPRADRPPTDGLGERWSDPADDLDGWLCQLVVHFDLDRFFRVDSPSGDDLDAGASEVTS